MNGADSSPIAYLWLCAPSPIPSQPIIFNDPRARYDIQITRTWCTQTTPIAFGVMQAGCRIFCPFLPTPCPSQTSIMLR